MNSENKTLHDDALTMVFLRNEFYKKKFYTVLVFFILSLLGIGILSYMLHYLVKNPPHPLYFVADPVGRLIQEPPLDQPNMSLNDVAYYVVEAVQSAYTYSYVDYRDELLHAQKYFTDYGWRKYMNGLVASNNINAITQRKFIQVGTIVQFPQLTVQGHMGSVYAYKFTLPLLVTYWYPPYDDKSRFSNALRITVVVLRASLLDSYKGLGIQQMNAELLTAPGT